jgi:hypothetical protein
MSNCHPRVDLTETDVLAVDGGLSQGRGIWRRQVQQYGHILRGGKRQERDVVNLLLDHTMSSRYSMNYRDGDSKYCLVVNIVIMI